MLTDKTKIVKGNGHINVSNVNAANSECITLTYTVTNFKSHNQVEKIRDGIYEIAKGDVDFNLETTDWNSEVERHKLKAKIKSCGDEKFAHTLKASIDKYIKKSGGITTLDEVLGD